MSLEPTRRIVTIALAGASLAPGLAIAAPRTPEDAWRAACLATEQAWIDENEAIERIAAQGVRHTNDRYHQAALYYWRTAFERRTLFFEDWLERTAERRKLRPATGARAVAVQQEEVDQCRRGLHVYEKDAAEFRRLAEQEDLAGHARRVEQAEQSEDGAADAMLKQASSAAAGDLRRQVALRNGETRAIAGEAGGFMLAELLGEGPGAAVSGRLNAAIIVRRLEALGYSLPGGRHVSLYDDEAQPETEAMRRRRARVLACGRSLPNLVADAEHFRTTLRYDEADWWMGPRPRMIIY